MYYTLDVLMPMTYIEHKIRIYISIWSVEDHCM